MSQDTLSYDMKFPRSSIFGRPGETMIFKLTPDSADFYNICKGLVIKIVCHQLIKFSPHRIGTAFSHSAAGLSVTFQTGNWCQITLCQTKNLSNPAILRRRFRRYPPPLPCTPSINPFSDNTGRIRSRYFSEISCLSAISFMGT